MMRLNAITACMAWSMLKLPPTKESHPATMVPSAAAIGVHRPRKINPALTAPTSLKKSVVASATPDHVETSNGVPAARRNSSRPHPGQLLGKVENMRCMDRRRRGYLHGTACGRLEQGIVQLPLRVAMGRESPAPRPASPHACDHLRRALRGCS